MEAALGDQARAHSLHRGDDQAECRGKEDLGLPDQVAPGEGAFAAAGNGGAEDHAGAAGVSEVGRRSFSDAAGWKAEVAQRDHRIPETVLSSGAGGAAATCASWAGEESRRATGGWCKESETRSQACGGGSSKIGGSNGSREPERDCREYWIGAGQGSEEREDYVGAGR